MPIAARHLQPDPDAIIARARGLLAAGQNDEAYAAYLEVLRHAPSHSAALHELGCLAHADGYRSAARTLYAQIVHHWPRDLIGRVNLGNILLEDGDLAAARHQFGAALEIDPDATDAHRGLGQCLSDQGDVAQADQHWRRSFPGQALARQLYRGRGPAIPVLLLVSAKGGNIPTRHILDSRIFEVTVLYAEYHKPDFPLPPHALIFNAIGDADLCSAALAAAEQVVTRSKAAVINPPARIGRTGRAANAARFSAIPNVRAPRILALRREEMSGAKALAFPLLLRSQGFHTGQHFVRVERPEGLEAAAAGLPGETLLVIEFLDARRPDGLARKYRVMCIAGALYPMHLAICADWKVHYFTADMAANAAYREEERHFLEDMPAVLGARAVATLLRVAESLGLDYCGIDFALDDAGSVLLFEANATMVIIPPPPEPMWDYRRAPVERALDAAKALLVAKSQGPI
jgi:glutathione synthase/RimK-type ligase-like ATP-grasp enzyme